MSKTQILTGAEAKAYAAKFRHNEWFAVESVEIHPDAGQVEGHEVSFGRAVFTNDDGTTADVYGLGNIPGEPVDTTAPAVEVGERVNVPLPFGIAALLEGWCLDNLDDKHYQYLGGVYFVVADGKAQAYCTSRTAAVWVAGLTASAVPPGLYWCPRRELRAVAAIDDCRALVQADLHAAERLPVVNPVAWPVGSGEAWASYYKAFANVEHAVALAQVDNSEDDEPREVRQTTKHLGRFMRAARHVADNAAVVFRPVKFPHGGATVATFDSSLDITIVMMNCARTA